MTSCTSRRPQKSLSRNYPEIIQGGLFRTVSEHFKGPMGKMGGGSLILISEKPGRQLHASYAHSLATADCIYIYTHNYIYIYTHV